MDYYWNRLNASDKAEYRTEIVEMKQQLEEAKKDLQYSEQDWKRDLG